MNDYNFKDDFKKLSEEELQTYVKDRQKYIPEAVAAAVEELQSRGYIFPEEELAAIREDVRIKAEEDAKRESVNPGIPLATVNAEDLPVFYSRQVISVFAVLFSAFFASILMAMNLSRTKTKQGVGNVIAFGLATNVLIMWLSSTMHNFGSVGILFNIIGGVVLNTYFWDKYIGRETPYRKRSFWVPLIIGLAIVALLIFILITPLAKY